jgi:predicted acetyltransferase
MKFPIRTATAEDWPAMLLVDAASFGGSSEPELEAESRELIDFDRFLLATDGDRLVGIAGDYPMNMALPGGGSLDVPGVTWVSAAPTHRRRGILRDLMQHELRQFAQSGYAAAILIASEGGIYGRFGYGAASTTRRIAIDRRRVRLRAPADASSVLVATPEQARTAMPEIHERWRRQIPGGLYRVPARWDHLVRDAPHRRHGMSKLQYLLHSDGYVAFRTVEDWTGGQPNNRCVIEQYAAVTPQAHAALWQVLLDLDLYVTIETDRAPADDPLPHLVTDSRQVRTVSVTDGLWLRPLDVTVLLASRRYAVDVDLVWQVDDSLFGGGRYRLVGGPEGASCERTDAPPDLVTDAAALGAVSLGGHRLQEFAAAGRVHADDPALLRRADRALLADRAPFYGTMF